jgi:hypothetical protein
MIGLRDLPAFIHQQGEREVELGAKFRVLAGALRIDSEDLDAERFGRAPVVAELAQLFGATGRIVARIEDEDDEFAPQSLERDGTAAVVGGGEFGAVEPTARGSENSQESIIAPRFGLRCYRMCRW